MQLRGVRVHNLKNLDLDIPLDRLVVISGVSGSGKSSLAFETLFREGQRRFIESFSIAARRQMERVEPPDADCVAHVPVAIAVRADRVGPRSTVASVAGLLDGLRLLFARLGQIVCPQCGRRIQAESAADVVRTVSEQNQGARCQLIFPANSSTTDDPVSAWLLRGFTRAIWNGSTHELNSKPRWPRSGEVWIVADRFVAGTTSAERILESAETAFREGEGRCSLLIPVDSSAPNSNPTPQPPKRRKAIDTKGLAESLASSASTGAAGADMTVDDHLWSVRQFSRRLECLTCHRQFLSPQPRLFSHFSSGACSSCHGTGRDGGAPDKLCPICEGTRLRSESLVVRVGDLNIAQLLQSKPPIIMDIVEQLSSSLSHDQLNFTEHIRADLSRRLAAVNDLGLSYLGLDRSANSLSSGELCRLSLAAVIGSRITGTLVVIDEPSAGLTVDEIPRVVTAVRRIQAARNSVVVVDHAPSLIEASDHLIELGPGAGPGGGSIVFQGPTGGLIKTEDAKLLEDRKTAAAKKQDDGNRLVLSNVNIRNLIQYHVEFLVRRLNVVTGRSGSGKTTLLTQVLFPAACRQLGLPCGILPPSDCEYSGTTGLVDVTIIDQSPLARSQRSNPATWLAVFDEIRRTFAMTADAKLKGFSSQHFSFNSSTGGRCRSCAGTGLLKHDMQFLPDVTLLCPECKGTRYRNEILEVKYRGRSIADVLAMSICEAAAFFRSQPRLQTKFRIVEQIGLDYLVLGQPSETLSGGEAQRLKLASRLAAPNRGPSLMICDEPTTGLHPIDVGKLLVCFQELIASGHTIVVADNNSQLVSAADQIVELKNP